MRTREQEMAAFKGLSTAEIAQELGCTTEHVCNLIRKGKFRPAVNIGSESRPMYRVSRAVVERFAAEHQAALREYRRQRAEMGSRYIPRALRRAVYERDGDSCQTCGSTERLSLDHVHPFSRGGLHEQANLRVLCRGCNSRKGNRA